MPARQRGSVEKLAKCWSARFADEDGVRRRHGGFATKTQARKWLDSKINEIEEVRRGEAPAQAREDLTVSEAISRYLAQHDVDVATTKKLTSQLRQAKTVFGDRPLDSLQPDELSAWHRSLPEGSRHDIFRGLKQVLRQAAS
jgi:signal recognition particle GTPase